MKYETVKFLWYNNTPSYAFSVSPEISPNRS